MRLFFLEVLLSVTVVLGTFACSSAHRAAPRPSAAIAIVMDGGGVPAASQVQEVHANLRPEIERLGYILAADSRLAEVVVHVRFTPDPRGPGGLISVLNVAPIVDQRQEAIAARERFRETSAKANRSQITEPR